MREETTFFWERLFYNGGNTEYGAELHGGVGNIKTLCNSAPNSVRLCGLDFIRVCDF